MINTDISSKDLKKKDQDLDLIQRLSELEEENQKLLEKEALSLKLNQLKKELLSPLDLNDKLNAVTRGIVDIFSADFARIWLIEEGDLCDKDCPHVKECEDRFSCLHLVASSGRYTHLDGEHKRVPIGSFKIGRIASGHDFKFITNDVVNDPRVHDHEWARKTGLVSFAGFKLSSEEGKPVGVLALFKKAPLNEDCEYLLEDLANTTSQVILASKAEKLLKESEKNLNAFINAITESAFMIDNHGNYRIVNDNLAKRLNRTKEELLGANAFDLLPDDVAEGRRAFLYEIYRTKKSKIFSDQREGRYFNNHLYPIFDDEGRVSSTVIFSVDVTDLKNAEKLLIESEERYRSLTETSPDLIIIYDDSGIIYANQAAIKIFKVDRLDELIGLKIEDFLHPDYLDKGKSRIYKAHKYDKRNKMMENQIYDRKGNLVDMETASVPIFYSGKKAIQITGRDITERKKVEKALKVSKKFTENIISSLMDGFAEFSNKGIQTGVNKAFCQMTGFSREELIDKAPPHPYWPEEEYEHIRSEFISVWDNDLKEMELILKRKTGERFPVLISPSVISDEEGNIVSAYATVKDISELKNREREVKSQNRILEGINQILGIAITTESEDELARKSLEVCEKITESKFGFILELNQDETLDALAISDPGWNECVVEEAVVKIKGMKEKGIHGMVTRKGEPILTNNPSNHPASIETPPGHPKLKSFLGVPLQQGERIIGSIGVANKEGGYTPEDLKNLEKLSISISESMMRKRAEISLKEALNDKELLLKEIHHRVKNNLMVISSLLSLQSEYVKDETSLEAFKNSQNRANSMALIHERLYRSTDLKNIGFGEYLSTLANDLFQTYVTDTSRIRLDLNIDDIKVDISDAIPLGLIVNELISNSLKYAFPDNREGCIYIKLSKPGDMLELTIADDGVGLPEDLDFYHTDSLGSQLIIRLTDQIKGELSLDTHKGTKFTIRFKEKFK